MDNAIKLTRTDRMILDSYKTVLDGLSEYLGTGYEIILHSLENIDQAAIKVINGHYTGRKEGAPITDLAMEMLAKIKKSGVTHSMIYFNHTEKGVPIRSSTIPIIGEHQRIIGLLCFNFHLDIPLYSFMDSIAKINGESNTVIETYASSTDELIRSAVEKAQTQVLNNLLISASNRNKEIIALLCQRDIFALKDAVSYVALLLGISKNTVYLHLRNLHNATAKPEA